MEIYHFKNIKRNQEKEIVLGIGKFDGVHVGHQKILERIIYVSKENGKTPSVFTFRNFPVEFYITPFEEKVVLFENYGIELCIWADFEEIRNWESEKFIKFLINIGVKSIVVGFNFRFGKDRKGDVEFLKKFSDNYNFFSVEVVEPFMKNGEIVNASKIREFIKNGEIEKANSFLGRYFSFKGKVISGSGRGRKIGFPTANISPEYRIEIGDGVYAGYIIFKEMVYKCAINIGLPLTFKEKEKRIEVHIIDFDKEIYGQNLKVFMVKKIRNLQIFKSSDELKRKIKQDIELIKKTLPSQINNITHF